MGKEKTYSVIVLSNNDLCELLTLLFDICFNLRFKERATAKAYLGK